MLRNKGNAASTGGPTHLCVYHFETRATPHKRLPKYIAGAARMAIERRIPGATGSPLPSLDGRTTRSNAHDAKAASREGATFENDAWSQTSVRYTIAAAASGGCVHMHAPTTSRATRATSIDHRATPK